MIRIGPGSHMIEAGQPGAVDESAPLIVATPIVEPGSRAHGAADEDGLSRASWPRTIGRLTLSPLQHPWSADWTLQRRGPPLLVAASILLLLLFALLGSAGCAQAPPQSLVDRVSAPQPPAGLRCESVLVSQEVQVPPTGELADVRLTIQNLPEVQGKLRVLVRRPRFASRLELDSEQAIRFDEVLEVAPGRQLTVVLTRPPGASDDWPRRSCKACRVEVELTGLFGAREGLDAYFARAMQDAVAIDQAFARQEKGPRAQSGLHELGEALATEARRCGVPLAKTFAAVEHALDKLDAARAQLYAFDPPQLPEVKLVVLAWTAAAEALDLQPAAAAAARAAGWPATLRWSRGRTLRTSALQLELAEQAAALPAQDKLLAARWIALALAPDAAAVDRRAAALPRIRDLADAEARLAWVDPQPDATLRLPGASRPATLRVREWLAARHGRRCIGRGGAVPVHDADDDAKAVLASLGLRVRDVDGLAPAREGLKRARELLCEAPAVDVSALFAGLEEKELGPVAERLGAIFKRVEGEPDELSRAVTAQSSTVVCRVLDPQNLQARIATVAGYKVFVDGGQNLLQLFPAPPVCRGTQLTASQVRRELRELYRSALDRHGPVNQLCPVRGGKCPEDIAASVRRIFSLQPPDLADPAAPGSAALDFPPPFGFGDAWVKKLDRCAREACDALARLRREAPEGQFDGAVCPAPVEGADRPQEVTLGRPESPSSVTLSSCDAHEGVRVTLRRKPEAGTLVSIASAHPFRYGSETVSRQGRHPQLGRIYERVADLSDPADVSQRAAGIFEVALTPTVAGQVFYFFSLRRRDY